MRVHISNLTGFGGNTVALAQYNTLKIGQSMGFSEIGIRRYDSNVDNDKEIKIRIEGILNPVIEGDIFIFQLPTWNFTRFDIELVHELRHRNISRLIIFLHDLPAELFEFNRQYYPEYKDRRPL